MQTNGSSSLLNIGPHLSIDKTYLSTGEVYAIVSNKDVHGGKVCIVVIIKSTKVCVVYEA